MNLEKIRVWDLPTRVFHWGIAFSFAIAYLTSESERYRDIHMAFGYVLGALMLFRLVWGLIGTQHVRFKAFWYSPQHIWAYMKSLMSQTHEHYISHNPLGSVAVYVLLLLGLATAGSGIMLYWEIGGEGVEEVWEEAHEFFANAMLLIVILHIVGVFFSSFLHKENLARAMVTGYKCGEADQAIPQNHTLLGIGLMLALVAFLGFYLYG